MQIQRRTLRLLQPSVEAVEAEEPFLLLPPLRCLSLERREEEKGRGEEEEQRGKPPAWGMGDSTYVVEQSEEDMDSVEKRGGGKTRGDRSRGEEEREREKGGSVGDGVCGSV
jgi:hypothetical protein